MRQFTFVSSRSSFAFSYHDPTHYILAWRFCARVYSLRIMLTQPVRATQSRSLVERHSGLSCRLVVSQG
jgi:hypothetical protein